MVFIGLTEDETTEFKESWNAAGLEAIAAFANTRGGALYLGVDVRGVVKGITLSDRDFSAMMDQISALGLNPSVERLFYGDSVVLKIEVAASSVLISYQGRYYKRVGNTTRLMTTEEVAAKLLSLYGPTWDSLPSGVNPDRISAVAIDSFRRYARDRMPAAAAVETDTILGNLTLIRDGQLNHAGVLLFTDTPQIYIPGATVHIGRFVAGGVQNDETITGNLWVQIERVTEWFHANLKNVSAVNTSELSAEAFRRDEVWEYPLPALREAVLNALAHRDYAAAGDIQIRLYEGRLEIWNPGFLPAGITIDDLRRPGHPSMPRNPLLAQAFHFAGFIERWGTGTTRMIEACRSVGLPEPLFSEDNGGFNALFSQDPFTADHLKSLGLKERQIKCVAFVKTEGSIDNKTYQTKYGVAKATATRDLEDLVAKGVLKKEGTTGRGTKYSLKGS